MDKICEFRQINGGIWFGGLRVPWDSISAFCRGRGPRGVIEPGSSVLTQYVYMHSQAVVKVQ